MYLISCDASHYKQIRTTSLHVDQPNRENMIQVREDLLTNLQYLYLLYYHCRCKRTDQYMHAWTRPYTTRRRSTLGDRLATDASDPILACSLVRLTPTTPCAEDYINTCPRDTSTHVFINFTPTRIPTTSARSRRLHRSHA
jgi:hypothetical protein